MSKAGVSEQSLPELENERDFLLRSLQDLEGEREAGDVSDEDYSSLHARYTSRAAEVLRAISSLEEELDAGSDSAASVDGGTGLDAEVAESQKSAVASGAVRKDGLDRGAKRRQASRKRRLLLAGGIVSLLAGIAVAVVVANTSNRLPGNTATGSGPSLPTGQQEQRDLVQAATLEQEGQLSEALAQYEKVISLDPGNSQALSEAGWLEFEAGILDKNKATLERGITNEEGAVALSPQLASARAYLGTMLLIEGQYKDAVVQYGQFLNDKPGAKYIEPFEPDIKRAYSEAKETVPSLPPTTSTTTKK